MGQYTEAMSGKLGDLDYISDCFESELLEVLHGFRHFDEALDGSLILCRAFVSTFVVSIVFLLEFQ